MNASVVNLRNEPRLRDALHFAHEHNNTVLIDRRTRWGNPFKLGVESDRDTVIARYRRELWRRIEADEIALADLAALSGKTLACWCAPEPCHGDILARAADWAARRLREAE